MHKIFSSLFWLFIVIGFSIETLLIWYNLLYWAVIFYHITASFMYIIQQKFIIIPHIEKNNQQYFKLRLYNLHDSITKYYYSVFLYISDYYIH